MKPIIATEILKGYKNPIYVGDYFIETPDKKYTLYFYNINETTMLAYHANMAIFAENKFNIPLLTSDKIRAWYSNAETFTYAQISECLIFTMPTGKTAKPSYPYLLIKPQTNQFSLIDWDVTSIYYFLEEVSKNILVVKEGSPKALDRLNYLRRTCELIDLNTLSWYDFTRFDNAREIYIDR